MVGWASTGEEATASLSFWNTHSSCWVHCQSWLFFVRLCRGWAISANPFLNLQYKLQNPMNSQTPWTLEGGIHSQIALHLSLSIWNPSLDSSTPRKSIQSLWNSHFFGLWNIFTSWHSWRNQQTAGTWVWMEGVWMLVSSRYPGYFLLVQVCCRGGC